MRPPGEPLEGRGNPYPALSPTAEPSGAADPRPRIAFYLHEEDPPRIGVRPHSTGNAFRLHQWLMSGRRVVDTLSIETFQPLKTVLYFVSEEMFRVPPQSLMDRLAALEAIGAEFVNPGLIVTLRYRFARETAASETRAATAREGATTPATHSGMTP